MERIANTTGMNPVPDHKHHTYQHEPDKFTRAGLTPQPSDLVTPPRVEQCALQFEATVKTNTPGHDGSYHLIEAEVLRVHARPHILTTDHRHINPNAWTPTIFNFRHYYGLGHAHGSRPST